MAVFALFFVQCLALSTASSETQEKIYPQWVSQYDEGGIKDLIDGNETSCVEIHGQFKASLAFLGIFQNIEVRICSEGKALSTEVEIRLKLHHTNIRLTSKSSRKSDCFFSYYKHPSIDPVINPNLSISVNEAEMAEKLIICEIEFIAVKASMKSHNTFSSTVDDDLQRHFSDPLEPEWSTTEGIVSVTAFSERYSILSSTVDNILQHQYSGSIELERSTTEPIIKTTDCTDELKPNSTSVPNNNQKISRNMLIVIVAGCVISIATIILVASLLAHCILHKLRRKSERIKDTSSLFDTKGSNFNIYLEFKNEVTTEDNQVPIPASHEIEDGTKTVSPSISEGNFKCINFSEKPDSEENHSSHTETNIKDCAIYDTQNKKVPCVEIMVENEIYSV